MSYLTNENATIYDCFVNGWIYGDACIIMMTFVSFVVGTLLVAMYSAGRIVYITSRNISPQLAINYFIIMKLILLLVYFSIFDLFWLYMVWELLKISIFMYFGYIFMVGAYDVNLLPLWATIRVIQMFFILSYITFLASTALAIYYEEGCANIPRVIFSGLQFLFSMILSFLSVIILKSREIITGHQSRSASFLVQHTKPLAIIMVFNTFTSLVYLTLRLFLFYLTPPGSLGCMWVLIHQEDWIIWTYPIFRLTDMVGPDWCAFWYFNTTIISAPPSLRFYPNPEDPPLPDESEE